MNIFFEEISIKFGGFYVIKMNTVYDTNCAVDSTPKYWWKFVYRPIFKRPIYRSVSNINVFFAQFLGGF